MQHEITEQGPLLDDSGRLVERGWARKPIRQYDRDDIAPGWWRIKEWDYYAVLGPSFGIAITVADLGYLGLLSASWLDFDTKREVGDSEIVPLPRGNFDLPAHPESGSIRLERRGVEVEFVPNSDGRTVSLDYPAFDDGRGLHVDLTLERDPGDDAVVIASDWEANRRRFYYNMKDPALPARGSITFGDRTEDVDETETFGVHDWGRGVWPYTSTWYWGVGGTWLDGVRVGWNFGYGFGDRDQATENAIVYDGTVHKLTDVQFHFDDYTGTWQITSSDDRVDMQFEPLFDRDDAINLRLLKTIQHQVFGHYSGSLILDDGTTLEVDEIIGFAEEVQSRW